MAKFNPVELVQQWRSQANYSKVHEGVEEVDLQERLLQEEGGHTAPEDDRNDLSTRQGGRSSIFFKCIFFVAAIFRHMRLFLQPTTLIELKNKKIHPTSWLDGLRGVAAMLVFFHHWGEAYFPRDRKAFNVDKPHFLQLPIIRLAYTGSTMVALFFVISGFVLSYRPLQLAIKGDGPRLYDALASSTFRRAIRLYLPCLAISALSVTTSYFKLFHTHNRNADPNTIYENVKKYMWGMLIGLDPFNDSIRHNDIFHTPLEQIEPNQWTIPFEYRGSIVIFVLLLGLGKVRQNLRVAMMFLIIVYVGILGEWDIFLFVAGSFCCQLHLWFEGRATKSVALPTTTTAHDAELKIRPAPSRARAIGRKACSALLFTVILYFLSLPIGESGFGSLPFYRSLNSLVPWSWTENPDCGRFWICVPGVLLIFFLDRNPFVRQLFSLRFPQYLGEISFMFYLIHGYMIDLVGRRMVAFVWPLVLGLGYSEAEAMPYYIAHGVVMPVLIVMVFYVADLLTQYVDKKSVVFARWAERRCFKAVQAVVR